MCSSIRPAYSWLFAATILCSLFLSGQSAQAQDEVHIVQPGETLSEIAQQHGFDTETLRLYNNLGDADLVWVGLRLQLPSGPDGIEERPAGVVSDAGTYVVEPGDSLSSVARAYQTSLARLVTLNRISPAQRLYAGQILIVPASEPTTAPVVVAPDAAEAPPAPAAPEVVEAPDVPEAPVTDVDLTVHIVQAGEHLGIIAQDYGVSALRISQMNELSNASLIVPGQRLIIPPPGDEQKTIQAPAEPGGFHTHEEIPTTGKWIDVDLSEQRVVAYEGAESVNEFIIASGKADTPTVTGSFRIWAKTPVQDMYGGSRAAGDYYYLENVQWVQYFHEDYAFHGTYWHTNFGTPQSRGCINMTNDDAEWLFNWATPVHTEETGWLLSDGENQGTLVVVHH